MSQLEKKTFKDSARDMSNAIVSDDISIWSTDEICLVEHSKWAFDVEFNQPVARVGSSIMNRRRQECKLLVGINKEHLIPLYTLCWTKNFSQSITIFFYRVDGIT